MPARVCVGCEREACVPGTPGAKHRRSSEQLEREETGGRRPWGGRMGRPGPPDSAPSLDTTVRLSPWRRLGGSWNSPPPAQEGPTDITPTQSQGASSCGRRGASSSGGAQWPIEAALPWGVCPLCSMLGVRQPRAPTRSVRSGPAQPTLPPWASVSSSPAFTPGSPGFSPFPGLELESWHTLGLRVPSSAPRQPRQAPRAVPVLVTPEGAAFVSSGPPRRQVRHKAAGTARHLLAPPCSSCPRFA